MPDKELTVEEALTEVRELLANAAHGPLTLIRYDHGGGRLYREEPRDLIADFYDASNRELYYRAPELLNALVEGVERLREDLRFRCEALDELRRCRDRWLTMLNPASADETVDGAIRNLQQAYISERDNALDLQSQLSQLQTFVSMIARMTKDGEGGFEATALDSFETIEALITKARELEKLWN